MPQIKATIAADFFRVIDPAYDRLTRAPSDDTLLEISLAPGEYTNEHFKLIDRHNSGRIAVWIHAEDPQQPPLLTNLNTNISAREIRLENLIFKDSHDGSPPVSLTARDRIQIDKCAFIGLRRSAWPEGEPIIEMQPGFAGKAAPTLSVRQSWFINNSQPGNSPLLNLTATNRAWSRVDFEYVAFLNNSAVFGLLLGATEQMRLRECFLQAWPDFIMVDSPRTKLSVENCIIVGDDFIRDRVDQDASSGRITPEHLDQLADDAPPRFTLTGNQHYTNADQLKFDHWIRQAVQGAAPDLQAIAAQIGS
jgi:hypothetical protein